MSNLMKLLCGGAVAPLYVDDVFSAFTRTGTGASATITTGIDLSTEGGCVWAKSRSAATGHRLQFTAIGAGTELITDTTGASAAAAQGVTAFGTTSHTIGTDTDYNTNAATYVDWVWRNAPNFYYHDVVTKSAGSNATYDFSMHTAGLGMVRVKRTDAAGSWYIWHRSLTAGKLLIGETTAAEATLGHITVSGTTVTLVNGVIADGTYLVEAWAHDTSADGLIQCGSFTTDGSGNATVTLGWEPQLCWRKNRGAISQWFMEDAARGMSQSGVKWLYPNLSDAEVDGGGWCKPTATGFNAYSMGATQTFTYLAIRRPNKPPTSGTQVYNAIARTGTGAAATVTGVGFAPDLCALHSRSGTTGGRWEDRLRGATQELVSETTAAESAVAQSITSFSMDGCALGTDGDWNTNTATYINHFFRRAPGFFDEVCDTGTGSAHTISHNLAAVPELMIRKKRSAVDAWYVYHANNTANPETDYLVLNTTAATADLDTIWNDTAPTSSVFTVGTHDDVNQNTGTFVTYLFATLAGISKCGTYTGNGSTQNIEMGFAAGARFFLVKATSTTGSWWVWDSVRGIVAGTDFGLQLNSTAAETTSADAVDPYAGGISVVEEATCALNTNGTVYVFLAVA